MRTSFPDDWFPRINLNITHFPPRKSMKCTVKAIPGCDFLDMHRVAVDHKTKQSAYSFLDGCARFKHEITFIFPHGHKFPDVHFEAVRGGDGGRLGGRFKWK
jgi:hypothetical protein